MARKRRPRRGVSVGTIVVIAVSAGILAFSAAVFLRISGDIGDIQLSPQLLAGPDASAPEAGSIAPVITPEPTATPSPAPTQPQRSGFRLTAVGQVSAGKDIRAGARDASGSYGFASVFGQIAPALTGTDLSIATLRTSLGDDAGAFDPTMTSTALAGALRGAGVNLVSLATDRVLDHGTAGLSSTLGAVTSAGLRTAGAYGESVSRDSALSLMDLGGLKVGVLAYTGTISQTGQKAAGDAGIAASTRMLSAEAAAQDIAALRADGADLVIVLPCWGAASDAQPSTETRAMADALATAGADIILGTGPQMVHTLDRRTVQGADGVSREVFIAYSLGSFLTDESRETPSITGLVLNLDIGWDAQRGGPVIEGAWYMPTWIMRYSEASGAYRYRIVPAGSTSMPQDMTDAIYSNMQKGYQTIVERLGEANAQPKAQP